MNFLAVFVTLPACVSVFSSQLFANTEEPAALREEIARHDILYYQKGTPEISDSEYDALKVRLEEFRQGESKRSIGDDRRSGFEKAKHIVPMLSLEKAYAESDLVEFCEHVAIEAHGENPGFLIEPKVDGVAINLVYEQGKLIQAISRGNGLEGDVLTNQVQEIINLPKSLNKTEDSDSPTPDLIEIRGEVYVPMETLYEINKERARAGEKLFATPRSLAAGSLRLIEPGEIRKRGLHIVVFGWGEWLPEDIRPKSYSAFKDLAKSWGLPVLNSGIVVEDPNDLYSSVSEQLKASKASGVPCDGVVVKVDNTSMRVALGESEQAPNWAIACKFKSGSALGRIKKIILNIGRTGNVTPIAEIEPVNLNNRIIRRINLHNANFISLMDIRIGDQVSVELSGDVIPVISGVITAGREEPLEAYNFPKNCPFCNSVFSTSNEGHSCRCTNYICPERTRRRLEHFADAVGLPDAGSARIERLVNMEGISSLAGLVESVDGGERLAEAELWKIIAGLSIPGVGPTMARKISAHFGSLKEILTVSREELALLELPESVTNAMLSYLSDPLTRREIEGLKQLM